MMSARPRKAKLEPPIKTGAVVAHLKTIANGWAGEKSKKPSAKAVKQAGKILSELETGHMPWPNIVVLPNGGISLSWVSLYRDLVITINKEGSSQFVASTKRLNESFEPVESFETEGFVIDMRTVGHMMVWFCTDKASQA